MTKTKLQFFFKQETFYFENVRYKFTSEFKLRISEGRNGNKSKHCVLFVPIILKFIWKIMSDC